MVRKPTHVDNSVPEEFPQVAPRDLHPTSDIRFVMTEVAKLSTLVERLIKDVGDQEKKIDDLRHQATFIKGGIAVAVVALGVVGWLINQALDGKLQAILTAVGPHK